MSTPAAVKVGAVPSAHLTAVGHVIVYAPPLVMIRVNTRQYPDVQLAVNVKLNAPRMVHVAMFPSAQSIVVLVVSDPSALISSYGAFKASFKPLGVTAKVVLVPAVVSNGVFVIYSRVWIFF